MKTIYLLDENGNDVAFNYEDISDLNEELEKRKISIGGHVRIGDVVSIGNHVSIGDHVSIGIHVSIENHVSIGDYASIGDSANIRDSASVGERTNIRNYASIGDSASIGVGVSIGHSASVGDCVELQRNLYIVGSKHCVTYTGNGTLSIGCNNFTIEKWLNDFEAIGKKHGYSEEAILEYEAYIKMAEQFDKLNK